MRAGVLVVVEHQNRNGDRALSRVSLEALAAGQALAKMLGAECAATVLGEGIAPLAGELSGKALSKVFAVEHPLLKTYTADGYVYALEQIVKKIEPGYVLFPHTYQVRDFAPALATRFQQVLLPDVIAVHDGPVFVRQLFQGKLNADYTPAGAPSAQAGVPGERSLLAGVEAGVPGERSLLAGVEAPCFVSLQAGSFKAEAVEAGTAPVEAMAVDLTPDRIRTRPSAPFRESAHTVDLSSAAVIVSVGRGIREAENIPLVQALANALGAELAASRPICDAGWVPIERQVGSSGQTVSPKLYLAVGISGAIQHLVGMKGAKTVIAINKDENAPIFEVADYGVAGDLFEIVPALTKAVQAAKTQR
jgi:electron transfer flavoprotein alpha subunit